MFMVQRPFIFFILIMPWIHRQWLPAARLLPIGPRQVYVSPGGAGLVFQLNPGIFLFGFLLFQIIIPHTFKEVIHALRVLNMLNTYIILLAKIVPLTCLFTTMPRACWVHYTLFQFCHTNICSIPF